MITTTTHPRTEISLVEELPVAELTTAAELETVPALDNEQLYYRHEFTDEPLPAQLDGYSHDPLSRSCLQVAKSMRDCGTYQSNINVEMLARNLRDLTFEIKNTTESDRLEHLLALQISALNGAFTALLASASTEDDQYLYTLKMGCALKAQSQCRQTHDTIKVIQAERRKSISHYHNRNW